LFDAVSDLEGDPFTHLFDEFGNYHHCVMVQSTDLHSSIDDILDCCDYAAQTHSMASDPPTTGDSSIPMPYTIAITIAPKEQDYKGPKTFL